jgi:mannose-6-phosphate isomerase-like protein (cupin superfamily)
VKNEQLTVIEEQMPSGTAETLHKHMKSRQFFYVLRGSAVMEHGGTVTELLAGVGLEIPPGIPHRIINRSGNAVEFLVTSQPPSHADRVELSSSHTSQPKR